MLDIAILRSVQTYEFIKANGWSSFWKETVYRDRRAVIFEKNLAETKDHRDVLARAAVTFIEIDNEIARGKYNYCYRNRCLKARYYLDKGFAGYGIVKGNEVIGEMWYCTADAADRHPDVSWLGVRLSGGDVYAFDWFVIPQNRGDNLAGIFQNEALYRLHRTGHEKAYAYVWADNTPALWSTRSISRWKEIRTVKMSRLLIARTN